MHVPNRKGTAITYRERACKAICNFKKETIFWPSEEERLEIAARIMQKYNWLNYIGLVDGMLLPLGCAGCTRLQWP